MNPLSGLRLDRCGGDRANPDWVRRQLTAHGCRVVPVWKDKNLIDADATGAPRLAPIAAASWLSQSPSDTFVLLGVDETGPWFAVDVSDLSIPESDPRLRRQIDKGAVFDDLRKAARLLPAFDAALGAYARGMLYWHRRHRYCGVCGSKTEVIEAGHKRRCANPTCAAEHFPRTDPAMIAHVHQGDRCLLGRNPRFPERMYSTIAGFVEPGESLEDCVIREVHEETGITVGNVRYHSSQPWPFPASLMVGFLAEAETDRIWTDGDEIEHALWISREDLLAERARGKEAEIQLPPRLSIARRLIDHWLDDWAA